MSKAGNANIASIKVTYTSPLDNYWALPMIHFLAVFYSSRRWEKVILLHFLGAPVPHRCHCLLARVMNHNSIREHCKHAVADTLVAFWTHPVFSDLDAP